MTFIINILKTTFELSKLSFNVPLHDTQKSLSFPRGMILAVFYSREAKSQSLKGVRGFKLVDAI